ncbi:ABC transporter permease [candidate division KSB1 bacterium]
MNNNKNILLLLVKKLLKLISSEKEYESFIGDVEEYYEELIQEKGKFSAGLWCFSQIIKSIGINLYLLLYWRSAMYRNYLKIALRNIKRQKSYSLINISGLAVGLACCILMLLWVNEELNFDMFHENANELARVITKTSSSNEVIETVRSAPAAGGVLVDRFPDIVNFTRYRYFAGQMLGYEEKAYLNDYMAVADPSFFEMFSFQFISGDPEKALSEKFSIVLTESLAEKYFGDEDPMGKIMFIQILREPFKVTGVVKDVPETSHIHFECVIPWAVCIDWFHADPNTWNIQQYGTYLQLRKGSSLDDINEKIRGIIKEHDETSRAEIYLQPMKDIHLRSDFTGDMVNYKKGNIKYTYIYSITAFCVLLIACINFMNLSTARSSRRAKEVGLRKVTGARRSHLLIQFLGESVILSLFSLFIALIIVYLMLPAFNNLTNKSLTMDLTSGFTLLAGCLGITILTGLVSGIYPALFLSGVQPVKALKDMGFKKGRGDVFLRKVLVMTQFVLSVILITGTIVVYDQLDYIKNRPLGYEPEGIINPGGYLLYHNNPDVIKNELLSDPDIISITRSMTPNFTPRGSQSFKWEGMNTDQEITVYPVNVDYSYLETFGMTMKEGRFFSREFGSDHNKMVINETMAKIMGIADPIGIKVRYEVMNLGTGRYDELESEIIGVMNDFHQSSLHSVIEPMIFTFSDQLPFVSLRVNPEKTAEVLDHLERTWKKYVDYPYTYKILSETIENNYSNDKKIGSVFSYFSILAIFISCLGLFGLTSYTTELRRKEIGIRRVVGASIPGVTVLLSGEVIRSVALSLIIASPAAWYIMNKWLESFAYRTDMTAVTLISTSLVTTLTAIISVLFQTVKAARANPVDTLKYE